jgi:hypothetical protein
VSDLRSLREIEIIWVRRMERAEDDLRQAQARQRRATQALEDAKAALADYLKRLPGLIEQLYADCIGFLVSREFVQDKTHDEGQLRARGAEFRAGVTEAESRPATAARPTARAPI